MGRLKLFAVHIVLRFVQDDLHEVYFVASVQAVGLDWERDAVQENST